jgi:hypothetical protein
MHSILKLWTTVSVTKKLLSQNLELSLDSADRKLLADWLLGVHSAKAQPVEVLVTKRYQRTQNQESVLATEGFSSQETP